MVRVFRYRLYPTRAQERALGETMRLLRGLYNGALQERRDAYRLQGRSIGAYEQMRSLKDVRALCPDYAAIHTHLLQDAHHAAGPRLPGLLSAMQGRREARLSSLQGARPLPHLPLQGRQEPQRGAPGGWRQAPRADGHRQGEGQIPPAYRRPGQAGVRLARWRWALVRGLCLSALGREGRAGPRLRRRLDRAIHGVRWTFRLRCTRT